MRNWSRFTFMVVALLWGTSFAFQKTLLDDISPFAFTFWNFGFAFVVLACLAFMRRANLLYRLREGIVLGSLLACLELFQMLGLSRSSSADTAFISNLGMLLIPYAGFVLFRHKIALKDNIAVVMAIIGMYLLVGGVHGFGFGQAMLLVSAVAMSLYFLYSQRFEGEKSSHVLTLLVQQFFTTAVISGAVVLFAGHRFAVPAAASGDFLWQVILFTVLPYVLIQWASQWADEMMALVYDGVVEPLVGGITSWVVFSEVATKANVLGAVLMVLAFSVGGLFTTRHFLQRGLRAFNALVR